MHSNNLSRTTSVNLKVLGVAVLALILAGSAFAAPRPTVYGQFANTQIDGTVIFWSDIRVDYEIERITLKVAAPCGEFTRTFDPAKTPFFDIAEIEREVNGTYTYELVLTPAVDPGVQEELESVRGTSKEDDMLWSFWDKGLIPRGPFRQGGFFEVEGSLIVSQTSEEEGAKSVAPGNDLEAVRVGAEDASASDSSLDGGLQSLSDAQTIAQSLCVGFDCPASPTFSDSTILMMENNTRIKFDDTSTASSFPRNDWEIEANSNLNGGGSWLAINDCGQSSQGGCADDPLLLIEAGAPSNSLRIDNAGRAGFGTANPVLELHTRNGDTPGLRLEQDTSSGFAAQTWDLAGNETSFFIRDATNGSTLPFRIRPGASSNSLVIDTDNDVGVGILSPSAALHVERSDGSAKLLVQETNGTAATRQLLELESNGAPQFRMEDTQAGGQAWAFTVGLSAFSISNFAVAGTQLQVDNNGDLRVQGNIFSGGTQLAVPDYVFEPSYSLMPLDELESFVTTNKHLPNVPNASAIHEEGLNHSEFQLRLLEKVEELTLYTLEQHNTLKELQSENTALQARLAALEEAQN